MFEFPEELGVLKTWMAGHGHDVTSIVSERQAAFHAQKLAGIYRKFPAKGQSCRAMLLAIQAAVVKHSEDRRAKRAHKSKPRQKTRKTPGNAVPAGEPGLIIFTDGSASPNPGRGGWGFVAYIDGVEVIARCGGNAETTSNLMELAAIASALNFVFYSRGTRPKGCSVRILSDSAYAVGVATKTLRPKKNTAMIDCIHMFLEDMPSVAVEWCRGHTGGIGNERADELAKRGRHMGKSANDNQGAAA